MAAISWQERRVRYLLLTLFLLAAGLGLGGPGCAPLPGRTESLTQLKPPSDTDAGPVKVVFHLPVSQPAVFLTIDDGWYPDSTVLGLMQTYHLPLTAFLIEKAMQDHPAYWRQFVQAGGHIEDHTYDHPFLTRIAAQKQYQEIAWPLDYFSRYVPRPDELRPPYGDYNAAVGMAAQKAGIKYVVMWDAEISHDHLYTLHNRPLQPGDIVLLHWVPGLGREISDLLPILQREKLGVADLTQALAGGPLTVTYLPPPPGQSTATQVYKKSVK
ncbi:MAG TPA: polysaccharide deacetylase family protein [Spirochaetia bacterium]|nr:polysaccharide deacetylase family protein [Spirochaetia bacterium]